MSDRISKLILEQDKILQEKRRKEGKEVTPYNYDIHADKDIVVARSLEASQEKIQENNKTLIIGGLEANAPQQPQKATNEKVEQKEINTLEAATINTSAIPSQEKNNTKELGDEDEKKGKER